MAQDEFGTSTKTSFVKMSLESHELSIKDDILEEKPDIAGDMNGHSVQKEQGEQLAALSSGEQVDKHIKDESSSPQSEVTLPTSSQTENSLPTLPLVVSSQDSEDNSAANCGNVEIDPQDVIQDGNGNNREETVNDTSMEAVSLVDIKALIPDEQEEVESVDRENSDKGVNELNIPDSKSPLGDGVDVSDLEISNLPGPTVENMTVVSSKTSDEPNDMTTNTSNPTRAISSYAIQPGELTDQLIEGPSITLPLSELSNRKSSLNTDNSPSATEEDKNNSEANASAESGPVSQSAKENLSSSSETSKPPDSGPSAIAGSSVPSPSSSSGPASPRATTSAPVPAKKVKKTPHDFIFGKVLGEGSYSMVYLAKEVSTQREFAVKVCEKKHLIRERKTHFVMREKEVLMKLDHPYFIKLAYTFQDVDRLYYVLTYARNGELLSYLNKLSVFDVPCTRFYMAEVVVALEYLQSLGIVHRDLKPENILLGDDMHIKITDFGTSKILNGETEAAEEEGKKTPSKRKNSFVGTAEYVTPEVLNGLPANFGTDLWALACIIYQCLSSSLPFRSGNEYQTFQKIIKLEYEFPEGFNEDAKDLITQILRIEPSERLGMREPGGMQELKQHPFFLGIDWDTLPTTTPPKLLPYLPATANNPEFWGGQEQRTGFDDQRLAEIITGQSVERCKSPELEPLSVMVDIGDRENEWKEKIEKQRLGNDFHQFVENNIILRQGFVDKRKGLFARKRMLLLTEGPHLYYVDAHNKVLKGEIPWSKDLRAEAKNFKIFFVHTPHRTYYLESRHPDAHHWVKRIQEVWTKYYENGHSS